MAHLVVEPRCDRYDGRPILSCACPLPAAFTAFDVHGFAIAHDSSRILDIVFSHVLGAFKSDQRCVPRHLEVHAPRPIQYCTWCFNIQQVTVCVHEAMTD